jgi:hypothetical protein
MHKVLEDTLPVQVNVRVWTEDKFGNVVDERTSHNVLTNIGRKWFRNLCGAAFYPASGSPTPVTTGLGDGQISGADRIGYMGVGVGGALASSVPAGLLNTQTETVDVTALEDPVKVLPASITGTNDLWLKQVEPQDSDNYYVDDFTMRFICSFIETDISFAGQVADRGGPDIALNTSVPVSEAGLYLTSADPEASPLDSSNATAQLAAYNIFAPITVTPNFVLRVLWEFRF